MNKTESNPSKVYALFYSFFLIPFMIAVFGGLFFYLFLFMTNEKNTPIDLLDNIQSGSATRRWTSAFELSNMLDQSKIDNRELFNSRLVDLYQKSKYETDPRLRTYLALAMGKTEDPYFGEFLVNGINEDINISNKIAAIQSIGMLRYEDGCNVLKKTIEESSNNSEILASIVSLGVIGNSVHKGTLLDMLNHDEPNIRWDSAIALAKMSDNSGAYIIEYLLDRNYYKNFPSKSDGSGLTLEEIDYSIYTAMKISQLLLEPKFKDELIYLSKNDKNIKIREFALKTLNEYYK
tara:strand:+ start:107 stop:982 length:876 start_codon:yes stop_codon:yes gene_type:complete